MIYAETTRLILRDWNVNDISAFVQINADKEVMKYFPKTLTAVESIAFYERIVGEFNEKGFGLYAVELKDTGEFIGYVGLHEIGFKADSTPGVEIGWRLRSSSHKNGYAPEAAFAVLKLAEEKGIKKLYSFTAKINEPSEKVMQKIGMVKIKEFHHPALSNDNPLSLHVLYKIEF